VFPSSNLNVDEVYKCKWKTVCETYREENMQADCSCNNLHFSCLHCNITLTKILRCKVISDKSDTLRVAIHERLGEVLRILRSVLERYPALQSTELLATAGTLIQQVKGNILVIIILFSYTVLCLLILYICILWD